MARQFSLQSPRIGVGWFVLMRRVGEKDGEKSEDSYAYLVHNSGHQYTYSRIHCWLWNSSWHMVGAKGAPGMEGFSKQHAQFVIDKVWKTAARLGYSDCLACIRNQVLWPMIMSINRINIPSIDIIHFNPSTRSGFGAHWHTHRDNMDIIDHNTLKAVGQTLLEVIFSEGGAVWYF